MTVLIRPEREADTAAIRALTDAAFADAPHSSGTEAAIVDALRADGALTLSLVAETGGVMIGHVAVSGVRVTAGVQRDGAQAEGATVAGGWFGLGPVSVLPGHQGQGIGAALIREALARLRDQGAAGCVVLGDPGYYPRFGFAVATGLRFDGVPPEYFMALSFGDAVPEGAVVYHPAFYG